MGTKIKLVVRLPSGEPVKGAVIVGTNQNAWFDPVRYWRATTGVDGAYIWTNLDTGVAGDMYEFRAEYVDDRGVRWVGFASERIWEPREISITLHPWYLGEVNLSDQVKNALGSSKEGQSVLEGIKELDLAIKGGLVQSAISLSTWVIEGMIRVKLTVMGKWKREWDHKTFAQLLEQSDVEQSIPPGLRARFKALAAVRTPSVHFKEGTSVPSEAQLGVSAVVQLAEEWFGVE